MHGEQPIDLGSRLRNRRELESTAERCQNELLGDDKAWWSRVLNNQANKLVIVVMNKWMIRVVNKIVNEVVSQRDARSVDEQVWAG